jgi:SagB-type dehydrogenase family enzyme
MSRTRFTLVRGAGSLLALAFATQACLGGSIMSPAEPTTSPASTTLSLPAPVTTGTLSLEEALTSRRSVREFASQPLSWAQIGQLLWAAQGITDAEGRRTAPSAGATYPLDLYAVTADATWLYVPAQHALASVQDRDLRPELRAAALDQAAVGTAPLVVVIVGVPSRTAERYGEERAIRYVQLEAGHAAQNLLLEAVALGLAAVPMGAFDDAQLGSVLDLPAGHTPLYLIPVGHAPDAVASAAPR